MTNDKPCCGNCFFWLDTTGKQILNVKPEQRDGICRAEPPTAMIVGMQMPPTALKGMPQKQPQPVVGSQFPPIKAFGWCGCYRTKPESPYPPHPETDGVSGDT